MADCKRAIAWHAMLPNFFRINLCDMLSIIKLQIERIQTQQFLHTSEAFGRNIYNIVLWKTIFVLVSGSALLPYLLPVLSREMSGTGTFLFYVLNTNCDT